MFQAVITETFAGSFSSTSIRLPCTNKDVGKTVCWPVHGTPHVSDGGGPQDEVKLEKVKKLLQHFTPKFVYHPIVLPKPKTQHLDTNTLNLLELTHKLLNATNPSLAADCWLCLSQDPMPYAFPFNFSQKFSFAENCQAFLPLLVQPILFSNTTCFLSNNTEDSTDSSIASLGFVTFANCDTYLNISDYSQNFREPNTNLTCPPNNTVFLCGSNRAYTAIPKTWTGSCTLAFILPQVDVINGAEPVPVPTFDYIAGRSKRAIQLLPIFATLGFTAAAATGSAGLGYSLQLKQVTEGLISDLQQVATTLTLLQDQIDSLAEVVLQNRRGLDLLLAEQGGLCLALQERCCFYTNRSGLVRNKIEDLQKTLENRRKQLAENPLLTIWNGLLPILLPILGPIVGLLFACALGPVLFQKLKMFIRQQVTSLFSRTIQIHYARLEMQDFS